MTTFQCCGAGAGSGAVTLCWLRLQPLTYTVHHVFGNIGLMLFLQGKNSVF